MEEQARAEDDPLLGQSVGNYVVRSKLGEGGMGAVYMAEHPLIGKRVALKVLHPELTTKQDVIERFFHEAKAVNDIQHPNIVDIIDYGKVEGERPSDTMFYFIMEYLDGNALTDVVQNQAPLPPERVRHIAMQIGDCLAASHQAGVIHRDLKPDNVMLVAKRHDNDFVKVLDFGIAKLTGDGHQSRKTRTGIVMGTPAYMSPEQCEGKGLIDHRSDVYALGVVLYEMLTGRVPFQGEGYGEVLVQHLTQQPASPSSITQNIPPSLEVVVLKALKKSRDDRYPSMAEFVKALYDPDGYVQSHGGLEGFLTADLGDPDDEPGTVLQYGRPDSVIPTPAPTYGRAQTNTPYPQTTPAPGMSTPLPAMAPGTPPPGVMSTPPPGVMSPPPGAMNTPYPGQAVPTPMGQHPSQAYSQAAPVGWPEPAKKSRLPIFVVLALLLVGGGVVAAVVLSSGESEQAAAGSAPQESGEEAGEEAEVAAAKEAEDEPEQGEPAAEDDAKDDEAGKGTEPAKDLPFEREIKFNTTPKGASVYIGDELAGKTPATLKLPDDDEPITVRLELDGYEVSEKTFKPNRDLVFDLDLKKERSRARGGRKTGGKTASSSKRTGKRTSRRDKRGSKGGKDSDTLRPSLGGKKKKDIDNTGVLRPKL